LCNATAIVFFIWAGLVALGPTLVVMLGTLVGGYAGIKLTHVLPAAVVREHPSLAQSVITCFAPSLKIKMKMCGVG
jgi:hypothetical protein